jgi:hypothetical protein
MSLGSLSTILAILKLGDMEWAVIMLFVTAKTGLYYLFFNILFTAFCSSYAATDSTVGLGVGLTNDMNTLAESGDCGCMQT